MPATARRFSGRPASTMRKVDDLGLVTFEGQLFSHPALDRMDGQNVYVCLVRGNRHRLNVWRHDQRRSDTPLCTATPIGGQRLATLRRMRREKAGQLVIAEVAR